MRTIAGYAVAAVLAGLVLAGCGPLGGGDGADEDGGASAGGKETGSEKEPQDAMLEFTQCMRDNGVDMPDPKTDGSMPAVPFTEGESGPRGKALEKCEDLMPVDENAPSSEEMHEQNLKMAQCLRAEGVDIEDPKKGEGLTIPFDPEDEESMRKVQKCRGESGDGAGVAIEKAE